MKKIFLVIVTLGFLCGTAQAATIWATDVIDYNLGDSSTTVGRIESANALGAPDGKFLSLGYNDDGVGGYAIFDFGTLFDSQALVIETTNGNPNGWKEYANVYVSSSLTPNTFTFVAGIDNFTTLGNNVIDLSLIAGNPFRYLKIVDTTFINLGHSGDGFDINAVGVNPVPEPATMMLFSIGLLGLAGVSRRKK